MIIKTAEIISNRACDTICANKFRILGVLENINNECKLNKLFEILVESVNIYDIEETDLTINKIFREEVPTGLSEKLIESYHNSKDKEVFVNSLKKSFIKRGTKGMLYAWFPLIERG